MRLYVSTNVRSAFQRRVLQGTIAGHQTAEQSDTVLQYTVVQDLSSWFLLYSANRYIDVDRRREPNRDGACTGECVSGA